MPYLFYMKRLRDLFFSGLALCICVLSEANAQSLGSSFEFLRLPVSAHSSSLGGYVVSAPDHNPSQFLSNPALLSSVDTRMIGLNAMSWLSGTVVAGAQFSDVMGKGGRYAFNARYIDYGKSVRTTPDGTETGTFNSKDMAVGVSCSYMLADGLSGGVTGNMICSHYASMTSVAVGVDLGLLYTVPGDEVFLGLAAMNLGGQVKAFENEFQKLPFDLCAGVTWKLSHAPLRLTMTMDNLTHWKKSDFYFAATDNSGFGGILKRHVSFGADVMLTDRFYVAAGCNLRNRAELSGDGRRSLTGFSLGTGLRLSKFSFDLSIGKYQVSQSSLICNFAFTI